jgi:hypothetical protein
LFDSSGVIETRTIIVSIPIEINPFVGSVGLGLTALTDFDVIQRADSFENKSFEKFLFLGDESIFSNQVKECTFSLTSVANYDDCFEDVCDLSESYLDLILNDL